MGDSFDLVDTGLFKETNELILQIEKQGFNIKLLHKIILTYCHCDHIDGGEQLKRQTGILIAAHSEDKPFILQEKIIGGLYRSMMAYEQKLMKRFDCNISSIDIVLKDGDIIDSLGGLQAIHVPGHTPGSIALYQAERKIMFFQDVVRNKVNKGLVIGVPEKFNIDTEQIVKDAYKLMQYDINYALFGHGEPILINTNYLLKAAKTPQEFAMWKKNAKKELMMKI
ncbi:hypothetical protein AZF37_01495 [endosymbiont 'TC1' of Trimyema compressum]|uniref:MBL fold metallo-hydrolase n=1 Tax=endosymbiont 'TC1' of Trimyema compressum TaxID=243899 RepID=UPI0007F1225A|nr:MBL fold metallo-hydrolase [endosymbiont 'TC1' of Trimyema compressum]AMP20025.1 hypothetical protein AZF37_01495 [endosymbiont 'TC1' of Trimyema compressum]